MFTISQIERNSLLVFLIVCATAVSADELDWISISNKHTQVVLEVLARYEPERASSIGIDRVDVEISNLGPGVFERYQVDRKLALDKLELIMEEETHPKVRQDLFILMKHLVNEIHSNQLRHEHMLPYFNIGQNVFGGIRAIIDTQVSQERYPAAVVRIRRYAGLEPGFRPITELAMARMQERFDVDGLLGPYRIEVEQDIERNDVFITGIEDLLAETNLTGWQEPYAVLARQLNDYNEWVSVNILPRSRNDYRLPQEMYVDALRQSGVDASAEDLIQIATQAYMDVRNEMDVIGALIAKRQGYDDKNYRAVIRQLKNDGSIDGDKLVNHYHAVLKEIESSIESEKLVSLPSREAGIRIATAAETAALPAPHLDVPRLLGNTGEYPYFVIPNFTRNEDGDWPQTDFNYEAGAWTLAAHEARPGHELQFSSMIENGLSLARTIFAFNSVNVEGWGLYAEAIAKPYFPLEGQLISLQYRLLRAARMFLDPMLNLGLISSEDAKSLLVEDVVIDETWAQDEIERYTYRSQGQATAYYFGYTRMQSLRTRTELALRSNFDQRSFHDFVLAQGMLPPELLSQAVLEEFIPSQSK